jgi:hypothetical protein
MQSAITLRLTIEPIPRSSRFATLAKLLPREQWDRLRRQVYRQAGYRCQICGREGRLFSHEIWQLNFDTDWQWLRGFQALCENCHGAKHLLFEFDPERCAWLIEHFVSVNGITRPEAEIHLRNAQRQQRFVDGRPWIVNFGEYNSIVPPLPDVQERRKYITLTRPQYQRERTA